MNFKVTEVDEEKSRLMLSNKRAAAQDAVAAYKVCAGRAVWVEGRGGWGGLCVCASLSAGRGRAGAVGERRAPACRGRC